VTATALDHVGRPRVAVTGTGVKNVAGQDVATFWQGLLAGVGLAARITQFDPSDMPADFACEIRDFDPTPYVDKPKDIRRLDRATLLAWGAAADAVAQAGDVGADPERCAVIMGTGVGGIGTLHEEILTYGQKGYRGVSPMLVPMFMANASAAHVAMQLGWTGPNLCISTACAASAHAVGEAMRLIRDGSADVVLCGGNEASINGTCIAAFWRMTALSTRRDDPVGASRPFDVDRDGFVMGEGSAALVLERWDRAVERGATILGEVLGYGRNTDAYHITAPSPGGSGAAACMQQALADAGLAPSAVGHVNAHGTSTPLNDAAESEAIRKVFGDAAPPVTSTKGVTGHLIGAAGATEAVAAVLAARTGLVPPTANFVRADDDSPLDIVHGGPRAIERAPVLSNSFGFGGHNVSLVIGPA
jgi:3-oxoacyl-[acyl-carrier-protein] synthase II